MPAKIVVPTDFSEYARLTARLVSEIPDAGEVVLLHVLRETSAASRALLGSRDTAYRREDAERSLRAEQEELARAGVAVKPEIIADEGGDPAAVILGYARREAVDLIMIGARGKGLVQGLVLGSVSREILRHATTSVLLVRHPPAWRLTPPIISRDIQAGGRLFSRVLFPVDFSKPCDEGFAFLQTIPGIDEIILLHVITRAENRQELDEAIRESYQGLQTLWNSFDEGKIRVTILIRFGRPAEMIGEVAEKKNATLIFMPRFGVTDFIRALPIGSTAQEVANQSRIPLFLFYPDIQLDEVTRELDREEFPLAEEVWSRDHHQTADPERDRIFGVLAEGILASLARCRRHQGSLEVDGVFTREEFRDHGYARACMELLVSTCGREPLYLHSTLPMVAFARQLGFEEIGEDQLPPAIKTRLDSARDLGDGPIIPMLRPADRG